MLEYNEIRNALAHARGEYPKESCGLVIDNKYVPMINTHDDPTKHFMIAPEAFIAAGSSLTGVEAIVHSHPEGQKSPSMNDMRRQMVTALPWCILPKGGDPVWFGDQCDIKPLIGREFLYGVTDCYSLIRDWYRLSKSVTLLDVPREMGWWNESNNLVMDNLVKAGFKLMGTDEPPEVGDIYLASLNSKILHHGFLYIGDGVILHHRNGRLSGREPASRYLKHFKKLLRYTK